MNKSWFRFTNPIFIMVLALVLCCISAVAGHIIKTNGGSVDVKEIFWQTPSGLTQHAWLFIPETASEEAKAPAIVLTHGWQDSADMQEENFIELSRRGYVAIAIDMYGHGDSDPVPENSWWDDDFGGNGVYDAVKYLAALPYVDSDKIGILGHSNGAYASNVAVLLDNEAQTPLIKAVFLEANDAYYSNTKYYGDFYHGEDTDYANVYKSRDVGLAAATKDEIMHRIHYADGTTTKPADFIKQDTAQSFLHFGQNPKSLPARTSGVMYRDEVDGKTAIRVIYTPNMIHPWGIISTRMTAFAIGFFEEALPAPNPIPAANQIWFMKVFTGLIGLTGFFMFFAGFILTMLKTRFFAALKTASPVLPMEVPPIGKKRLWHGFIVSALASTFLWPICFLAGALLRPGFLNQQQTYILGLWSVANAIVSLLLMRGDYKKYGRETGITLHDRGILLNREKVLKTIALAVLAVVVTYSLPFLSNLLLKVDFRFWIMLKIRPFTLERLAEILKFAPFFLIYYIVNSVAVNAFNYILHGKRPWVNILTVAVFNAMGPALVIAFFYTYFLITGLMPTDSLAWGLSSGSFWLYAMLIILPLSAVLSRLIYKATRNPYIHGVAFGLLITIMQCTNTLTT